MDWDDFWETFFDPHLWLHVVKVMVGAVVSVGGLLIAVWYFALL